MNLSADIDEGSERRDQSLVTETCNGSSNAWGHIPGRCVLQLEAPCQKASEDGGIADMRHP